MPLVLERNPIFRAFLASDCGLYHQTVRHYAVQYVISAMSVSFVFAAARRRRRYARINKDENGLLLREAVYARAREMALIRWPFR